jgi:phage terminase large subunit
MKYVPTTATRKIMGLTKRIRIVCGGTSASKTISILLYLIDLAQRDAKGTLTSVVSESFPHLQRGAMRDFLDILKEQEYYNDDRWNQTGHIYTFENGSMIEFFSADQPTKVRGPRRDRLFINEANNIPFETFDQLSIRTNEFIFCDHNPTFEYWAYTDVINVRDDVDFIVLTYKDNEALDLRVVAEIEQHKGNRMWWQVYGLGLLGDVEGKIYKDWQIIDEVPHEAKLERHWLDFGYSNDPASIGDIYSYNGGLILDQQLYQKGLSNKQLADRILNLEKALTVADSSEPKSIDEIASYGIPIIPAIKGRDSISYGIKVVQDQRISITKRSIETIDEYRKYM